MDVVNEGTTAYLTVAFLDKTGAAALPVAVSYRIDCLSSGAAVKAATSVTPATSVEITLSATDNAILAGLPAERRRVTVEATYAGSEAVRDQYDYDLRNLGFVT